MASPQFARFLARLEQVRSSTGAVDIESMRRNLDRTGGRFPEGVVGTPTTIGGVPAEWIDAPGAARDAAILYLHGGGYVAGSIDSHRNLTGTLARAAGVRVLALDYRLAPEHPFPAALDDALAAYGALVADEGIDASRLAIAGDSAGGGLTAATLLALRDTGAPLPALGVLISPWVDLAGTGDSMRTRKDADPMVHPDSLAAMTTRYAGSLAPDDPRVSPLYADLRGLPPLLIQVGDAEVLLDDSTRLAAAIEAVGGEVTLEVWPEMVHVWHGSAGHVPEADAAIAAIGSTVRTRFGLDA